MPWSDDPEYRRAYHRQYHQTWYVARKEKRQAQIYAWKLQVQQFVQDLKESAKCADCGEGHPATLDFHHIKSEEKVFNIADAIRQGYSIARIKTEIAKCIILCSNCHRIRHWQESKNKRRVDEELAGQVERVQKLGHPTPEEERSYAVMFGTSDDPEYEYEEYQEYFGVNRENQ
jgi:5-methylcytosine-specific restriction endonuclease McrA